jgi:hypothetical protein
MRLETSAHRIRRLLGPAMECGRSVLCGGVRFLTHQVNRTPDTQGEGKSQPDDSEKVDGFAAHISTPVLTEP